MNPLKIEHVLLPTSWVHNVNQKYNVENTEILNTTSETLSWKVEQTYVRGIYSLAYVYVSSYNSQRTTPTTKCVLPSCQPHESIPAQLFKWYFLCIWWWTAILITDIKNHVYLKNPPNHVNRTLLRQPTTNDAVCIFDSTRTLTHLISLCPMSPFPIACARKQSAAPVHPCAHKKSSMLLKRTRRYQLTKSDSARITYGSVSTVVRCPPSIKTSKKVTSTGVTLVCWYCQQENM